MAGVARVGVDIAGGVIDTPLVPTVKVNGAPIAVVGEGVAPHGSYQHAVAVMLKGSSTVFAGGIPVCRAGDAASCGHTVSGGSTNVLAG